MFDLSVAMAVAQLRLPLSASKGLIAEALTPRCLAAVTPRGLPRVPSSHSFHEPTTPKTPISCRSPTASMGSSAAARLLNNAGISFKASASDKDDITVPSFDDACHPDEFPRLLGRASMFAPPAADGTVQHGKASRRVHFDTSETQLAMSARDAFLARQRRIGTRRS